jgi:hypothetical protein
MLVRADRARLRQLVVLTDGLPQPSTPDEARAAARAARDAGIEMAAVGLGDDVDHALLADVAGDPARYHFAPDGEDLRAIFVALSRPIAACAPWPRE